MLRPMNNLLIQTTKIKIRAVVLSGIMALLASPGQVQATTPPSITIKPVIGFTSLQEAIARLLPIVFFVGGLLCFIYLLWGAYKYLTAGDNAANTAAARQTMINAVIGLILLALVVVIFNIVASIVGLDVVFF